MLLKGFIYGFSILGESFPNNAFFPTKAAHASGLGLSSTHHVACFPTIHFLVIFFLLIELIHVYEEGYIHIHFVRKKNQPDSRHRPKPFETHPYL